MQPNQIPKIMEIMRNIWFGMGLLLLVNFTAKITGLTLLEYGALPAAIAFGGLSLLVLGAIVSATGGLRGTRL